MNDYSRLARQLGKVRRAWKRTAALSGLFMVLVESAAVFGLLLLFNFFYVHPTARLGALILTGAAVCVLMWRHMIAPLLRRIPDEQVALYVEEHRREFEGSLMTAAEFGRRSGFLPAQAGMVSAAVRAATTRAERSTPARVVDPSRLWKYGVVAVILAAGYAVSFLSSPEVREHASMAILWWRSPERPSRLSSPLTDVSAQPTVEAPMEFALFYRKVRIPALAGETPLYPRAALEFAAPQPWAGAAGAIRGAIATQLALDEFAVAYLRPRVVRGSTVEVEVLLSRPPKDPVVLHVRDVARGKTDARWDDIPMRQSDRLNGFREDLKDRSEDVEFYVTTGTDKSLRPRVVFYDPLVLKDAQIATRYPAYLNLPDRVADLAGGELTAVEGSQMTVQITTNRPLVEGLLLWQDGRRQEMTIDPRRPGVATAGFPVPPDGNSHGLSWKVVSDDLQEIPSGEPFFVRSVPDDPPTVERQFPEGAVTTHPLGEIPIIAEAGDDFGVDAVDLVYMRGVSPGTPEVRVTMVVKRPGGAGSPLPGTFPVVLNFRLEDLRPAIQPEEVISYYLECRDRKAQKAVSDIALITIAPFEIWGTLLPVESEEGAGEEENKDLEPYLRAAWRLHMQKEKLSPSDFNRQCEELAGSMINPKTQNLYEFHKRKIKDAVKAEHARKADQFIAHGHKALQGHDTAVAVMDFRLALAELALAGLVTQIVEEISPGQVRTGGADGGRENDPQQMLQAIRAEADRNKLNVERPREDPRKQEEAKIAEDIRNKARELLKQQEQIAGKANDLAKDQAAKAGQPPQASQPNQSGQNAQSEEARKLAGTQEDLADKTRGLAGEINQKKDAAPQVAKTAENVDRAAKAMDKAAKDLKAGNVSQAAQDANQAKEELQAAQNALKGLEQDKLENALADVEARAGRLLENQRQTRQKTEEVASGDGKSDAARDRDLKKLTHEQIQHKVELEKVRTDIEDLQKKAKESEKGDAAKEIENAYREINRGQVDQKMTNAVVDLTEKRGSQAAKEQKEAEGGLEKVVERLRRAGDALAADPLSELRRAKGEAQRIERDLTKLAPRPASQPAQDPRPTPREKQDAADRLPYEVKRFADHLESRQFADAADTSYLKDAARNQPGLAQQLKETPKGEEMLPVVRRIRNKLEAEYQSQLDNQRLFSAQREECPPQYRHLVNKYYEAMSKMRNP